MALSVNTKYSGQRLDHPNFKDVSQTTYAKGVITDFQKIQDDPIKVASMVKVKGDWGESDFIPLFYCPKKLYWDNPLAEPPVLATDFDVATGAFQQSWQSFRCDDEVNVMLKEGVPVAVLGFADKVPRVGEAIVKVSSEHDRFFNLPNGSQYTDGDQGPDGVDLGLTLKAELIKDEDWSPPGVASLTILISSTVVVTMEPYCIHPDGGEGDPPIYENRPWVDLHQTYQNISFIEKKQWYAVKVGPFVYLIRVGIGKAYSIDIFNNHFANWQTSGYPYDWTDIAYDPIVREGVSVGDFLNRNMEAVWVGIYSKDFYDRTIAEAKSTSFYDVSLNTYIKPEGFYDYGFLSIYDPINIAINNPSDLEFFVRPHTKEELQAAGMWPSEG